MQVSIFEIETAAAATSPVPRPRLRLQALRVGGPLVIGGLCRAAANPEGSTATNKIGLAGFLARAGPEKSAVVCNTILRGGICMSPNFLDRRLALSSC